MVFQEMLYAFFIEDNEATKLKHDEDKKEGDEGYIGIKPKAP